MNSSTITVAGLPLHNITAQSLRNKIDEAVIQCRPISIATVNPEFIVAAHGNKRFYNTLLKFDYRVVDGSGIMLLTRIFTRQRFIERVTGSDLSNDLLKDASTKHYRVMILGGSSKVSRLAEVNIKKQYPELSIDCYDGGIINPDDIRSEVINKITDYKPDILLVALGSPKQEYFISAIKQRCKIPVTVGVGGTIDFLSGTIKRAPKIITQLYLEWLWRLILQPSRLKRIYRATILFPLIYIISIFKSHKTSH